jgi:hypothetical protein
MTPVIKKFALLASLVILLIFIIFVINETVQVVELAERMSPSLGAVVLWTLLVVYAVLIFVPVFLFLRLPRSLVPPKSDASPEFDLFLNQLGKRLSSNPHLKGLDLSNREQIEKALAVLGGKADAIIQQAALNVFISTAISQSGRLDTFLVVSVQSRMVWQIARLYYQRPTLRDLIRLYANVVGTAFVAGELDDIDISQQVEPIMSSALGTVALSIPGLRVAGSILINSVITGAANAFLTLRVGIVAKRYCGSLILAEKRTVRRLATAEAARLLGSIVRQGSTRLSRALWETSKGKVGGTVGGVKGYARNAGLSLLSRVGLRKGDKSTEGNAAAGPEAGPQKTDHSSTADPGEDDPQPEPA